MSPRGNRSGGGAGGGGRGRMGGSKAAGPGGSCRCPKCGATFPHQAGVPCYQRSCSQCGTKLTRA